MELPENNKARQDLLDLLNFIRDKPDFSASDLRRLTEKRFRISVRSAETHVLRATAERKLAFFWHGKRRRYPLFSVVKFLQIQRSGLVSRAEINKILGFYPAEMAESDG